MRADNVGSSTWKTTASYSLEQPISYACAAAVAGRVN
jgi:hypothetical protein